MEDVGTSFVEAFADVFSMPPLDIIIGLLCIFIFLLNVSHKTADHEKTHRYENHAADNHNEPIGRESPNQFVAEFFERELGTFVGNRHVQQKAEYDSEN